MKIRPWHLYAAVISSFIAGLICAAPTTQQVQWTQASADGPGKQLGIVSITTVWPGGPFTATPTPPAPPAPPVVVDPPNVVRVGVDRAVKDLRKPIDGREYIVDPGSYDVGTIDVHGSIAIRSADPDNQATLRFPSCWDTKRPAGPDPLSPRREGTIHVYSGKATLKDLTIVGGEDVIVLGSDPKASIDVDNVTLDGGGIWRGSGGQKIRIRAQSTGKPRGYFAACFTNPVQDLLLDFTGMLPVQQGGVHLSGVHGGEDQGDAAIRICNVLRCEIIGLQTVPWLDRDGKPWKQDVQLRPASKTFILRDCKLRLVDIGDIRAHYDKPRNVSLVQFFGCTLARDPHYTPGAKVIEFHDTKIGGVTTNKKVKK